MSQQNIKMMPDEESVWKFTWTDAVRAEDIAMDLKGAGLDFDVNQGYSVRDRDWTYSATITFRGNPRQAEALFNAIAARPWGIKNMTVEAYQPEAVRVMF